MTKEQILDILNSFEYHKIVSTYIKLKLPDCSEHRINSFINMSQGFGLSDAVFKHIHEEWKTQFGISTLSNTNGRLIMFV